MRTPLALLVSTSLALSYAASSAAQPIDAATKATARQFGEDGMKAYDAGDCPTATNYLTRAHDLVHVPTLAFYAGKCLEKLGRLVDAEEMYLEATRDPVDPGAPAAVKAAQGDADKARHALLPRIPMVQLTFQVPVTDALVTLDGKPVPPAMLGVKRPIDPGAHTVQVQRAGAMTSRPFTLHESETKNVVLEVPAPGAMPAPGAFPPPSYYAPPAGPPVYYGAPAAPGPVYGPPPILMQRRSTGLFAAGLVLVGLSTFVAIGGGVLEVNESADKMTNPRASTTPGLALLGVGLVGMAGGIVMAVIGGKKVPVDAPPPPVSFEPLLGPTSAGLRVRF
jgi:hypothetical protein